jgi:hypothetical protein
VHHLLHPTAMHPVQRWIDCVMQALQTHLHDLANTNVQCTDVDASVSSIGGCWHLRLRGDQLSDCRGRGGAESACKPKSSTSQEIECRYN